MPSAEFTEKTVSGRGDSPCRDLEANVGERAPLRVEAPPRPPPNTAPLGLIAFGSTMFMLGLFDLGAVGGATTPNIMVGNLLWFGGLAMFGSSIGEFILGNTFPGTIFAAYAAFNFALGMIYLPGTGIMAAYMDPETQALSPEFGKAMAVLLWSWFIVTSIFVIGAIKTTAVFFGALVFADLTIMFLAVKNMTGITAIGYVAAACGLVDAALAYYAGAAILWASACNGINLPMIPLVKQKEY